jgi:hypothetical protein
MTKLEELKAAHEAAVAVYIAAVDVARETPFDSYEGDDWGAYEAVVEVYNAAYDVAAAAWVAYQEELEKQGNSDDY